MIDLCDFVKKIADKVNPKIKQESSLFLILVSNKL